ncbi:MAG TPA: hypothetical protein VLI54_00930 [Bacillota bacterium]|nr:hypothetical protein [Bacillota bacterium]
MGLFTKTKQRITISSEAQDALEAVASGIRARKLKGTKVSDVSRGDGEWQCSIGCKQAEALYYQEVLPLLRGSADAQSWNIALEFADESQLAARCPQEVLVSFALESGRAYGNEAENNLIQQLHADAQSVSGAPAAVAYYIISDHAVTMCVPCADPEAMEQAIKSKLSALGIRKFMIKTISRVRA